MLQTRASKEILDFGIIGHIPIVHRSTRITCLNLYHFDGYAACPVKSRRKSQSIDLIVGTASSNLYRSIIRISTLNIRKIDPELSDHVVDHTQDKAIELEYDEIIN